MYGSMNIKFMEGDYHRQRWTTWFLWKEVTKTVTYSLSVTCSFVEKQHLHAALCSTGYRASTVARKPHRQLYMSGVTTPQKNDSLKPFESSKADGSYVWPKRGFWWGSSCFIFSRKIKLLQTSWVQINCSVV